ncbi:hypothetical protein DDB_G0267930 [Dictyostelium discoideum AX4]|uniref:Uncharacterized protein DDB_G0267930 n=1 Tax=Dictyostelium discoideum TaxID=44689 RepID=Y8238_DICDI|nr:hypothetical protein DDB_G0267930 [Dictyostelium discoideum AX4]Q55FV7.1 RecName: Full=Uncharacterized protein DDB_G0267930 [Dictyostelium discoideum]EAL73418.1 hypothetical protein DDB_G0267930 [Dictyostelium discoideum AX4]|eukprot:XP_647426.1 hypothetical protein DDB_G0267930 [Dictyostelium discoideum AX4]
MNKVVSINIAEILKSHATHKSLMVRNKNFLRSSNGSVPIYSNSILQPPTTATNNNNENNFNLVNDTIDDLELAIENAGGKQFW